MKKYKLHVMYDGTNYSGWQIQDHIVSIQQLIQDAVRTLVREEVNIVGSGRTDAGVHAEDQVVHFRCTNEQNPKHLFKALNGMLPKDIRVSAVEEVPMSFHAQKSAIGKEYRYHLVLGPYASPFERNYVWHVPYTIDRDLLEQAAKLFLGTHDFRSFANAAHTGAAAKNSIRTMTKLDVVPRENGLMLVFQANGFLYKMVRNIVGMLINVASGKKQLSDIPVILAAKDRRKAPMAAPPQGLFLHKVFYK
ncbi:MAG: tRNA pseudouridine(38-40) synthase TruA [Chlamydiales bacterium]|nr:tRNA pseudouridine(38-40) synthase TruA [Chlamydiales bacterium]